VKRTSAPALFLVGVFLLGGCHPVVEKVVPDRANVGDVIDLRDPIHGSLLPQGAVYFGRMESPAVVSWGAEDVYVEVPAGLSGDVPVFVEIYNIKSNIVELSVREQDPDLGILCFGDSIVYQGLPETLQWLIDQDEFLSGLNPVVINQGRSSELLSRETTRIRWTNALDFHDFDLVVLLEATNDLSDNENTSMADIQQSAMRMIDEALLRGRVLVLCTLLPRVGACGDVASPTTEEYNEWLVSYAIAKGIPVVDVYEGFVSTPGWEQLFFNADCVHPNARGNEQMASLLAEKIREIYLAP
jgi:lysophospholipase L1-like esterase